MAARCSSPPDSSPGQVVGPIGDADPLQQLGPAGAPLGPVEQERELHVLEDRERRDEVEELEDEADLAAPHARAVSQAHRADIPIPEQDGAGVGNVEPAGEVQERGLPRAALADQRDELALSDGQVHVVEGHHLTRPGGVPLGDALELQQAHLRPPVKPLEGRYRCELTGAA